MKSKKKKLKIILIILKIFPQNIRKRFKNVITKKNCRNKPEVQQSLAKGTCRKNFSVFGGWPQISCLLRLHYIMYKITLHAKHVKLQNITTA